jgi:hypothetical protein
MRVVAGESEDISDRKIKKSAVMRAGSWREQIEMSKIRARRAVDIEVIGKRMDGLVAEGKNKDDPL